MVPGQHGGPPRWPASPAQMDDDDGGIVMRGSTGREVGVTRPKRRLSTTVDRKNAPSTTRLPHQSYVYDRPLTSAAPFPTPAKSSSNYFAATKDGAPTLFGLELKWISLLTLALQNAFLTIVMHYSRISTPPDKTYMAAAAVLLNELLKGAISTVIALKRIDTAMTASQAPAAPAVFDVDKAGAAAALLARSPVAAAIASMLQPSRLASLAKQVLSPDCYKLAVPAVLYVIQNNLQYIAASNLDVATFQVTYQMKILTTAFFSVILLGKRLTRAKWLALLLLAVGVGIVQLQTSSSSGSAAHHAGERALRPVRGFVAVTLACMTSGLAGVYFELLLKSSSAGAAPPPDLWIRNTQLSLFSLVPAVAPVLFTPADGRPWLSRVAGCFANFNGWAITTVLTQTFGGLVTALVIRYSDNIMKGFATSLSIILSFLASVALFNYPITVSFVVGAATVLLSTYLYNAPNAPLVADPPTRSAVAVQPGSPISPSAPILGQPAAERPSRASSVINLLGLAANWSGASSSRQPSATDLRAAGGPLHAYHAHPAHAAPYPPPAGYAGSSSSLATGASPMFTPYASAPGTPGSLSRRASASALGEGAGGAAGGGAHAAGPAWSSVGGVPVVGPGAGGRTGRPGLTVDTGN